MVNIWDIKITPEMVGADGTVQCMGGKLWTPAGAVVKDGIDVLIVDKDGVIPDIIDMTHGSLMEHYGLPTDGSTFLEAAPKILDNANIPIGDVAGRSFSPGGNEQLPAGLYLRIVYRAFGSSYSELQIDLNLAR